MYMNVVDRTFRCYCTFYFSLHDRNNLLQYDLINIRFFTFNDKCSYSLAQPIIVLRFYLLDLKSLHRKNNKWFCCKFVLIGYLEPFSVTRVVTQCINNKES